MSVLGMISTGDADMAGLKRLQKKQPEIFAFAFEKAMIQMLKWMNTGSPRESRTPPIKTAVLRGSSSAIRNGKVVATGPRVPGATPATSGGGSGNTSGAWVYNTDYATKMHEWPGGWGKYTIDAVDAGNKWAEKHVAADREAFFKMIAGDIGKGIDGA